MSRLRWCHCRCVGKILVSCGCGFRRFHNEPTANSHFVHPSTSALSFFQVQTLSLQGNNHTLNIFNVITVSDHMLPHVMCGWALNSASTRGSRPRFALCFSFAAIQLASVQSPSIGSVVLVCRGPVLYLCETTYHLMLSRHCGTARHGT